MTDLIDLQFLTKIGESRLWPSRVFEVEHEFLDFAQGDADVVFRAAVHGRLRGRRASLAALRRPRRWHRHSRPLALATRAWADSTAWRRPGVMTSSEDRAGELEIFGPARESQPVACTGASSVPKTASRRSTASLRWLWRNRSIALSITTCLARPVARSVAVTLRIPFKSRSSRTRIWLPAGTSASPSIVNSPTRVL